MMVLSFDTPSGVAAEVTSTRFPEEDEWLFNAVRWLGDIDGDDRAELGADLKDEILAFDAEALPRVAEERDGRAIVKAGGFLPQGSDADVDGDGQGDLCIIDARSIELGFAVVYGPFDEPREAPSFVSAEERNAVLPGDLDGDGDDEFLLDPMSSGLLAWSTVAGDFAPTDEGGVLRQCLGATHFYDGFRAGDSDGDGAPDLFDGVHLLHGPSILDPAAAGCEALVLSTFDPEGRTVLHGVTGDLDGDGVSDLVLLVADGDGVGDLQVHRGPIPPGSFDSGNAEVVVPFLGPATNAPAGGVDLADIDGDGRDDLVVAMEAPRGSPPGMGAVYVWKGGDLLPPR
jgi:hypothetical protein